MYPIWVREQGISSLVDSLKWLRQLRDSVDSAAIFGCWSEEPLALAWILDASEVAVVEIDEEHLARARQALEMISKKYTLPEVQSVKFIVADMTKRVDKLPNGHFDLAFCREVLSHISEGCRLENIQSAVNEMARVVGPGGWVVADESSLHAKHGTAKISHLFRMADLECDSLEEAPYWSYCYRKPPYPRTPT